MVGACGTVVAVMELDDVEAIALPFELEATTVKVYATPDWSPATEIGDIPVPLYPPVEDVAV
jgi:hypothetical protein